MPRARSPKGSGRVAPAATRARLGAAWFRLLLDRVPAGLRPRGHGCYSTESRQGSDRVVPAATQPGPGKARTAWSRLPLDRVPAGLGAACAQARARGAGQPPARGPRGGARRVRGGRRAAGGRRTHPLWPSSSSPACRPACPGTTRPSSSCAAARRASAAVRRTWGARGPRGPGAGAARVRAALVAALAAAAAAACSAWGVARRARPRRRPPPPARPRPCGARRPRSRRPLGRCGHHFQPAGCPRALGRSHAARHTHSQSEVVLPRLSAAVGTDLRLPPPSPPVLHL